MKNKYDALVGKKWGDLTKKQRQELLRIAHVWDNVKGDCIVDFTDVLSIEGYYAEHEITIADDAVLYDSRG